MTWDWNDAAHLLVLALIVASNLCVWRAMRVSDRMKKEKGE